MKKPAKQQYISIPFSIMMRADLSQSEKIIYGFVNGFRVSKKICYASNMYIGKVVGLSPDSVSRCISTLKTSGLISITAPKGRSRSLFTSDTPDTNDGLTPTLTTDNNKVNNKNNNIVYNKVDVNDKVKSIGTFTGTKSQWDALSPAWQQIHKSQQ